MGRQPVISACIQVTTNGHDDYSVAIVADITRETAEIVYEVTRDVVILVMSRIIRHGGFGEIDLISDPEYGHQVNLAGYYTKHLSTRARETIHSGLQSIENKVARNPLTKEQLRCNLLMKFSVVKYGAK